MIAIDTNIVVRAIADDDAQQVVRVEKLLARSDIFVSTTVLLETEWVLRAVYKLSRSTIADSIEKFCGLETVVLQEPVQTQRALDAFRAGADFADALHLLGCESAAVAEFATFDAGMRKSLRTLVTTVAFVTP